MAVFLFSSFDRPSHIKNSVQPISNDLEVKRASTDAELSSRKSSRASRTSLGSSSTKKGLLESQDSLLGEMGNAEHLRPSSAPAFSSSLHQITDGISRLDPVHGISASSTDPYAAEAANYVLPKPRPTTDLQALQMTLVRACFKRIAESVTICIPLHSSMSKLCSVIQLLVPCAGEHVAANGGGPRGSTAA